jgi:hypothetical protein
MLQKPDKRFKRFLRGWREVQNQLIQIVPEELAVCEFDCRAGNCTVRQWKTCERRIHEAAA